MLNTEKILRSLSLAGVEWELQCEDFDNQLITPTKESFAFPKSVRPLSNSDILEIATRKAKEKDIITAIKSFSEHPLYKGAKNTVFPEISGDKILVIIDIPSLEDDKTGSILSGSEGELFDKMIAAIGLCRAEISITPLVFWRPAGGRTPTADEVSFCRPFIQKIINQVKATKIITLGQAAAEAICGAKLKRDHGKEMMMENLKVIPIYKPDFILQNPNVKKSVWEALKQIRNC